MTANAPALAVATALAAMLAAIDAPAFLPGTTAMNDDHATRTGSAESPASHPYVGMWVTDDGRIRHQLLPGGRYDEARGTQESAYRGRYEITGTHIEYWDDTGFTADGDFVDKDTLHHAGMVLRRRPASGSPATPP